ncbi:MAG: aminotransferase class IV [Flavobacteriaceae bacterium]
MLNFNGQLIETSKNELYDNRAFLFGDAVFETLKVSDNKILFFEDHYFRLMSSMRILRMEIPMNFTMEYIEKQIFNLISTKEKSPAFRVRITVYRNAEGYYLPTTNDVSFLINALPLKNPIYAFTDAAYEVDLYKDFYVSKQLLSSVKSTNRALNITGSIFAHENGLDNCLLLNDTKNVVETLNGNIFMLTGKKLITPPVSEGCIGGIMRKQILALAKKHQDIEVSEAVISPFDLQKADELFTTNIIQGIRSITKYRKKEFGTALAQDLVVRLNALIRLG